MPGEMLKFISTGLDRNAKTSKEKCIFRVHDGLRRHNPQAYEPEIVAIGPYHHAKSKLPKMEKHKLWYLHQLLLQRGESSVERYIVASSQLEERTRKCYAEEISPSNDEFVEMMCLDGCFLIDTFNEILPV